ncbi:MAG: ribonuclease HII [Erysipelotrichaceae bacterium]|nr:ribonuclease HII [Erysipelotrichaceae bacterium]
MEDMFQYERKLQQDGIQVIGGVDEVGRGPLIGNVVAVCVVLPIDFQLDGLTDSKKLSEKKRNEFYEVICDKALAIGVGEVSEKEIDEVNIYQATKKAMKIAIEEANNKIKIEHVLIDAMPLDIDIPTTSIIKGDAKSITIAAASVVAKVIRDREMYELDKIYPMYDLAHNKGYGTKKHLQAIERYGITKYHRLTYAPVTKYKNKINKIEKEING